MIVSILNRHSLQDLIAKLEGAGPHKTEKTARRVRGLLNGKFIFDTNEAVYVWEHPYCTIQNLLSRERHLLTSVLDPQFYIPRKAFLKGVLEGPDDVEKSTIAKLAVGGKSTDRVIIFSSSSGPLSGLVKVDFESIGKFHHLPKGFMSPWA
jgi:hypothetical protein